jgi:hypothetical protein
MADFRQPALRRRLGPRLVYENMAQSRSRGYGVSVMVKAPRKSPILKPVAASCG